MSQLCAETNKHKTKETENIVDKSRELMIEKHAISATENDRFDVVGNLPSELAQIIFSHLNPLDLRNALRTCRKWKNLVSDEYFWKRKCEIDNYLEGNVETSGSKVCKTFFHGCENYWEKMYVYNEALHQNWQSYIFREKNRYLPEGGTKIHHFDDKIVIMTHATKVLYVYDYYAENNVAIWILPGRFGTHMVRKTLDFVVCIHETENYLLVYSISTGLFQLGLDLSSDSMISKVVIDKNLIAFLFSDGSCEIVNILSGKVEHIIPIERSVQYLCFLEDQVAFGNYSDGIVKLLNWQDKMITATLFHDEATICNIMASSDYLISISLDVIHVWNVKSRTMLHRIADISGEIDFDNACFSNHRTILINTVMQQHDTLQAWDIIDGVCKFTIVLENRLLKEPILMNQHYIFDYPRTGNRTNIDLWSRETGERITRFTLKFDFINPLVTNTKLFYLIRDKCTLRDSMQVLDFEKEIKLGQLNALYT